MANSKGYIGKIANQGPQVVKAPTQSVKKGNSSKMTGNYLRNGRGKK